ncbi:flagellar basal body rod protein FlgB [Luteitalea sp.]|uniref:flagellar basal body rod protein FlgB n=1 Tax=Luteitalea sp. TaxID=2004800 RepID=UPI0025BF7902|nr:flagellar basal body rod protein FlgB [Luteitalea sp.]
MPLSPITSDAQMMSALRQTLSRAAAKQVVSASNLANLSTPGYKAQEVDFDTTLDQQGGGGRLAVTNSRHIGGGDQSVGEYQTRTSEDVAGRRDGNTVQVDRELLNMTRAAGEFARAQTALAAKFRLVRYAINESR